MSCSITVYTKINSCIHDKMFTVSELSPGFGTLHPMGHVDFYVNGGSDQPGCATNVNQHLMRILRGNFS